ncbi:MAG: hypothetical protein PHY47_15990 [Lachnospiraceae bacterium]|nr:hypothetical protein [Lachnospiraceae bacterium]
MINIKGKVMELMEAICPDASDSFPDDFSKDTQIQYTEEENRAQDTSGNRVITSYIRYKIDIWNKKSTSDLACAVDEKINGVLGLKRTGCTDSNEPGRKHKVMRYEGIIVESNGNILSPN